MNSINVLVACEFSQRVTKELRSIGFNAYSCDIIPCQSYDGVCYPEFHIISDVFKVLPGGDFLVQSGDIISIQSWDVLIAFPPCTYLADVGARHFDRAFGFRALDRFISRDKAVDFFLGLLRCSIPHKLIENPVGYINKFISPSQIVDPYNFGDPYRKSTCFWAVDFPPLDIIYPEKNDFLPLWIYECSRGLSWSSDECKRLRSLTFPGIARAIAQSCKKIFEKN